MDRALSGGTILGQSGPGSDDNEGVLRIPQSSSITGTSSDCLVSYQDTPWGGALTLLERSSRCILQPQLTGHSEKVCAFFCKDVVNSFEKCIYTIREVMKNELLT